MGPHTPDLRAADTKLNLWDRSLLYACASMHVVSISSAAGPFLRTISVAAVYTVVKSEIEIFVLCQTTECPSAIACISH